MLRIRVNGGKCLQNVPEAAQPANCETKIESVSLGNPYHIMEIAGEGLTPGSAYTSAYTAQLDSRWSLDPWLWGTYPREHANDSRHMWDNADLNWIILVCQFSAGETINCITKEMPYVWGFLITVTVLFQPESARQASAEGALCVQEYREKLWKLPH